MNKKKIAKISAVVASAVVVLVGAIVGVNAYIRHRNVVETGNILGVEWYNETDPQFTITTVEQLYELAELSDFYNFKGQTIKLGADLVVNEGNAEDWAKNAPSKRWNPITGFAGTFDGQNHTISGLYGKGFERRMALFVDTQMSCSVKNLSLTNSYFETTGHRGTASIVSHGGGKFKKIYSDAIIVHKGENVGGIASTIDVQSTFEECWFDGDINITSRDCGGIIDEVLGARVTVKHCLFSGYIYSNYDVGGTRTGGIFGRTDKAATIVLSDSLSSGTIECEKTVYTGATLGASYNGVQFTIEDTYASTETYGTAIGESGKKGTFTGTPLLMSASELTGVKAYQWTTLNFDSYWSVVEDGTPILKCFADTVPSLEGVKKVYDTSWYIPGGFDFTLMTREQLYGFFIVSAKTDYKDCKVKLGADIVVNEGDASKWAKEEPEMPWFPIATFAGQFDGQGHTISGLYTKASNSYVGFFGQATAPSIIQNVSLKNSYFEKIGTSAAFMGSIVGDTYGIVQNIYSDAIIVSEGNQVGGIVGRLNDNDKTMSNMRIDGEDYSVMSNCWFDGSIKMLAWEEENTGACEAGGLVGRVVQGDAIIEHCLNSGIISSDVTGRALMVGGLVGYAVNAGQLQITDCLNVGEIKTDYTICVGSVIGRGNTAERIITVKNTYATKESFEKAAISKNSLKSTVKGDVICVDKSWIEGNKGYQFTTLDFDKYWTVVVGPDGTPILSQFASKKPSVKGLAKMVDTSWYKVDAKEMVIDSVADLYGLAMLSSATNFSEQTIKLAGDITVNPVDAATLATWVNRTAAPEYGWITIGSSSKPFAGTFDGQGHTIRGIFSVSEAQYNGLFGATTPTSMIKNLSLVDSYFAFTGSNLTEEGKEAAAYMGSIAGDLRGDMDSVYSNAIVTSTANQVGGLVGRANGAKDADGKLTTSTINNCWFEGQVILTGETARYAGGIAAIAVQGTVEFTNCLNSGSVSNERDNAGQFLGGILGTEWTACTVNIKGCLNTGSIAAKYVNSVGSIVGRIQKKDSAFNITDTYATKESCVNTDGKPTTIGSRAKDAKEKGGAGTISEAMLSGYGGYQYTMLDFDKYWTVVVNPDETPVLKTFADSTPSLDGKESIQDWYRSDAKTMEIDSVVDLYGLSILSEIIDFAGQTVKLTQDVDLDPTVEWLPIGSTSKPFAGTFDGGMNTITGMYVDNETAYIGMFAVTSPTSMVKNFYLEDSTFIYSGPSMQYNAEKQKDEEVGAYMGSIVGDLRGDLDIVYSSATVKSVAMQVGGLVGRANGIKVDGKYTTSTINNCWFDGQVSLTGETARYAGGIAGVAIQGNIEITNCLNTGSVSNERPDGGVFLGGFIGTDWGQSTIKISDSVSAGSVTAANVNCIGSIMGRVQKSGSEVTITNTYAMKGCCTKADGKTDVDVWSNHADAKVEGEAIFIAESELLGVEAYKWTNLNFDATAGKWVARKEQIPRLKSFVKKGEEKSVADVIKPDTSWYDKDAAELYIGTEEELLGFAKLVNNGTTFKNQTVYLTKDLDMNPSWNDGDAEAPANAWVPIGQYKAAVFDGTFNGEYDGKTYSISGVYCVNDKTDESYVGLFGVLGSNSTVENVILLDSYFSRTAPYSEKYAFMGSIAGEVRGTLDTVYSKATVVSSYGQVGGLIGRANGLKVNEKFTTVDIKNCWYDGNVKLSGENGVYAAGIAAVVVQGTVNIENCLNTGNVISTGKESGKMYLGGIVATDWNASNINLTNCLNAGEVKADGAENYMGSVYGRRNVTGSIYTLINTYATNDSCKRTNPDTQVEEPKATGGGETGTKTSGSPMLKDDLNGVKGYTDTLLDFEEYWVARTSDVPALKSFVATGALNQNEVASIEGVQQNNWYDDNVKVYYIGTATALKGFSDCVNNGTNFSGKTVYLTKDIDLNPGWTAPENTSQAVSGNPEKWEPIGNNAKVNNVNNRFQGRFDGQGNSIKGVYIESTSSYVGLFGYVNNNATIENFQLTNSYFKGTKLDSLGWGSIAGQLDNATLQNVYSNAVMCYIGRQIGGLAGRSNNSVTIERCWFDGEIDASYVKANGDADAAGVGGIAGVTAGGSLNITDCLNTGKVKSTATHSTNQNTPIAIGGIFGTDWAASTVIISGCLNKGQITTVLHQGVGAIVGRAQSTGSVFEITDCYALKTSIANRTFEDIGYINTSKNPSVSPDTQEERCPSKEIQQLVGADIYKDVTEGGLNLNYGVWVARTSDVPVPRYFVGTIVKESDTVADTTGRVYADTSWLTDGTGDGSSANPYKLDSAGDFLGFAQLVNAGDTFSGKTIQLTTDINMNNGWDVTLGTAPSTPKNIWTPIGYNGKKFSGIFDGGGNTISGIYLNSSETITGMGLFGKTGGAQIRNFKLTDSYFKNTATGALGWGSIVGLCDSATTIENIYSSAYLECSGRQIGGITGRTNAVTVNNCWFAGQIKLSGSGDVARGAGGIVGASNTGTVTINNCLYTGVIRTERTNIGTKQQALGGLMGIDWGATTLVSISNSLSAGKIEVLVDEENAHNDIGSVVGRMNHKDSEYEITNTYGTNECWGGTEHATYVGVGSRNNATSIKAGYQVTKVSKQSILGNGALTGASGLFNSEKTDKWATIATSDGVSQDGIPVLSHFKNWYITNVLSGENE